MGDKYLPTRKDQKASQRFMKKQMTRSKFIKPAAPRPAAKSAPAKQTRTD